MAVKTALTMALVMAAGLVPPPAAALGAVPAVLALPGTKATLREDPADPLIVTSYTLGKPAYLRTYGNAEFTRKTAYSEITVAPGGAAAVAVPVRYSAGRDAAVLIDRRTGKATRIPTVKKPLVNGYPYWHRGGRLVVLTVQKKQAKSWVTTGFTLVDAATRKTRTVTVSGVDPAATFQWAPDGRHLVTRHGTGIRFYTTAGAVQRTLAETGRPTGGEEVFSPSGTRLTTWCPPRYREHVCLVDAASGRVAVRVPVKPEAVWGWWDDLHLLAVLARSGGYQVAVVDLKGQVVRNLATIPAAEWKKKLYLGYTRT
ncbi:hypothetical protein Misp01_57810 [Microtetraspora sp. NBRC 13810]|uniref:hypothetical protein n=1 Tax=Microtetraspora sp. NBRC 13810 TaxID=3030990 RepID=UPI0024A2937B|nr:hypothetical protein [Microtetraspora sp. NBRC 13810]GLW10653.1 hypothetical protein Misp01_57810 [Microtetraspora sp. NBRC 13810]